jgi:hypothetical protein
MLILLSRTTFLGERKGRWRAERCRRYFPGRVIGGSLGPPEIVSITVEPIRDHLFLVTWQEADKTTVVRRRSAAVADRRRTRRSVMFVMIVFSL